MTSVVLSKSSCWTKYIIFPGKVSEKTESNYSSASVGSENSRTLRSNSNLGRSNSNLGRSNSNLGRSNSNNNFAPSNSDLGNKTSSRSNSGNSNTGRSTRGKSNPARSTLNINSVLQIHVQRIILFLTQILI